MKSTHPQFIVGSPENKTKKNKMVYISQAKIDDGLSLFPRMADTPYNTQRQCAPTINKFFFFFFFYHKNYHHNDVTNNKETELFLIFIHYADTYFLGSTTHTH